MEIIEPWIVWKRVWFHNFKYLKNYLLNTLKGQVNWNEIKEMQKRLYIWWRNLAQVVLKSWIQLVIDIDTKKVFQPIECWNNCPIYSIDDVYSVWNFRAFEVTFATYTWDVVWHSSPENPWTFNNDPVTIRTNPKWKTSQHVLMNADTFRFVRINWAVIKYIDAIHEIDWKNIALVCMLSCMYCYIDLYTMEEIKDKKVINKFNAKCNNQEN